MTYQQSASQTGSQLPHRLTIGFLIAGAVIIAAAVYLSLVPNARTGSAGAFVVSLPSVFVEPPGDAVNMPRDRGLHDQGGNPGGKLDIADGLVPGGIGVLDDGYPAIANLDPELKVALRRAAAAAERDGVSFTVNSGWRSVAYQQQLLDEAVANYGSAEEAARWVARPENSAHVSGDAVDIGPDRAAEWLGDHGADYGLCQVYRNEPWHFELRPAAVTNGCPRQYADPTQDPRMQG